MKQPLIFNALRFFPAKETMRITSLSNEAFDNLASVLDKDSTIGRKKLMTEGFSNIYSQKDVEEIEQKSSPAKALLNDLDGREVSLENLIIALDRIGNKRAISIIINNSSCHRGRTFDTGQNFCDVLFLLL